MPSGASSWGDSLTVGFAPQLNLVLRDGANDFGIWGETSAQIKARLLAADAFLHYQPTTIWAGRNDDLSTPAVTEANIASMVSATVNTNYLILSIPPFGLNNEAAGQANYAKLNTINANLATTYGSKFFNVKTYLQGFGNGSTQDNADIAADLIPSSLRIDTLHLTTAGYALLAARAKVLMGLP